MENLGLKTPVSRLQEYAVAKKLLLKYELVYNGTGTHNPIFTFRVQVGLDSAEGTGRSKQEAKHKAAEKLLQKLNLIPKADAEEQEDEFNQEPIENYVGQLKELCILNYYPEPKYFVEEEAGPPHSKVFKMICFVSQLQSSGISKTKKQAKHLAAQKMIECLKKLISNKTDQGTPTKKAENSKLPEVKKTNYTDDEIIEKFNALKPLNPVVVNPAVYYKDHYNAYVGLQETSSCLSKIIQEDSHIDSDNALSLINEIAQELEVTLNCREMPTVSKNPMYIITMTVTPPIAAVGKSEKHAALNLLKSVLDFSR